MNTSDRARHDRAGDVDFLVALEHAPLVLGVLDRHGVRHVRSEDSPALGLTRIQGVLDRSTGGAPRDPADDVEFVLASLRRFFEKQYAHWSPTMGKNRLVGQVTGGGGTVSHGGGPEPQGAKAGQRRQGTAGSGVTVGVLDTALFPHPDLAGTYVGRPRTDVLASPRVEAGSTQPYAAGHATFVTGLVLREAPGASVRVRRVLNSQGEASSWDVARAIVELGRSGVQILNLSFVCYTDDGQPPLGLSAAVDRLDPDVLVVACAGNHGDPHLGLDKQGRRKPSWPAALDDVVAVGSGRREAGWEAGSEASSEAPGYRLSEFTPPGAAWIDVVTEGEELVSTYFTGTGARLTPAGAVVSDAHFNGWATWSGTSFSAALVAGRVAAFASKHRLPPREAYQQLVGMLPPGGLDPLGHPRPPFLDL